MDYMQHQIPSTEALMALAGNLDENIQYIEKRLAVEIQVRENNLIISGKKAEICDRLINNLFMLIQMGHRIDGQKIDYAIEMIQVDLNSDILALYQHTICVTPSGQVVTPKTLGQKKYLELIENKDLVFGLGPAGTGKTYLAVAMAIRAFKNKQVKKIIITRPAIEAGENLGYLPGNLQMKVEPYLRPVYDAMTQMLGQDAFEHYRERGFIEIAPLAYMRGRTLDNAFIVLDEAQNTTIQQMKMFLTRFGYGSKVIINGDVTQVDLKSADQSGLQHATSILGELDEIGIMNFTEQDVVRHGLVKKIISCYEESGE
ncbi:MAG: PhoH family protein [Clostridia bacterium]|nr:PhoH family protein [Clostridia bacterium]